MRFTMHSRRLVAVATSALVATLALWWSLRWQEAQEASASASITTVEGGTRQVARSDGSKHGNLHDAATAPIRFPQTTASASDATDASANRAAMRKELYAAARFIDAARQLESRLGVDDPALLRELFQLQQLCTSIIDPHVRTVQVLDPDQGNWALAGLLDQCEGFEFDPMRLKTAGVGPVDLWTEFNVQGADAPGLQSRMLEAITSTDRPIGELAMMMGQLNAVDALPGLRLRSAGSQIPVSPMVFDVALAMRECERIGGCGPEVMLTREFCAFIAPCAPGVSLGEAVRQGLSPRDASDIDAVLAWLRHHGRP